MRLPGPMLLASSRGANRRPLSCSTGESLDGGAAFMTAPGVRVAAAVCRRAGRPVVRGPPRAYTARKDTSDPEFREAAAWLARIQEVRT